MSLVPRSRLLVLFAAIALPLALLVAAVPSLSFAGAGIAAAFAAVMILDAWGARGSLAGIGIDLPGITRMSKDRESKVEVRVQNKSERARQLRLALDLPPQITSPVEDMQVALPAGVPWSQLFWNCRPIERGKYIIKSVYAEGASALGLWSVRKRFAVQAEIRVYPNLITERKNLAALFLNRGPFGLHARRQVGKGRDFERLREYVPGDSFDEIHWKATARRAKPITKVFQIERTQEVYVVLDASRLSARESSPGTSILERLVTSALVLGLAAENQGDLFGLLTHADKVESFVRARNGKAHYAACRDALYTLRPRVVSPDFDELFAFIRVRLRRRAMIVFLTSLDDPVLAESFVRNTELIRRQHLVLVAMIRQPGLKPLFSDDRAASIDDIYSELGQHLRWQKLRQLDKTLRRRGVQFSLIDSERLSAELVSQYMNIKQRQLI
jgi:uncharacterized protein (DUF58 family)